MDAPTARYTLANVVDDGPELVDALCSICGKSLSTYMPTRLNDGTLALFEPERGRDRYPSGSYDMNLIYLWSTERRSSRKRGRLLPVHDGFIWHLSWRCGCGASGYRRADRLGALLVTRDEKTGRFTLIL
jgi:hypothetical protein